MGMTGRIETPTFVGMTREDRDSHFHGNDKKRMDSRFLGNDRMRMLGFDESTPYIFYFLFLSLLNTIYSILDTIFVFLTNKLSYANIN